MKPRLPVPTHNVSVMTIKNHPRRFQDDYYVSSTEIPQTPLTIDYEISTRTLNYLNYNKYVPRKRVCNGDKLLNPQTRIKVDLYACATLFLLKPLHTYTPGSHLPDSSIARISRTFTNHPSPVLKVVARLSGMT